MEFYVIKPGESGPAVFHGFGERAKNFVFLKAIRWNDYSFYTTFDMTVFDSDASQIHVGKVRIGYQGQEPGEALFDRIPREFTKLGDEYFSLGFSHEYYESVTQYSMYIDLLSGLKDIALDVTLIDKFKDEDVLNLSLLRDVSATTVRNEYSRIIRGLPVLTDFRFGFQCVGAYEESTYNLDFEVVKNSVPPSNIHAVIGKNGVGKTTLFNRMVEAALEVGTIGSGHFYETDRKSLFGEQYSGLEAGYFSRVLSISFSAFDTYNHPEDNDQPAKGPCYSYLGLVDSSNGRLKSHEEIYLEFASSLAVVFSDSDVLNDWHDTISKLTETNNFNGLSFSEFIAAYDRCGGFDAYHHAENREFDHQFKLELQPLLESLSSGHFIVLRIVVELLRRVETKTLVLIDEPETHLHPPLLSALIRTISKILHFRNGVAIAATHSPVVLQEIPKSCVWKIYREGISFRVSRPSIETYGENIGTLTEEVFALDIDKSGFIKDLELMVDDGGTFDEIIKKYNGQLGTEARFILKSLISNRGETQK